MTDKNTDLSKVDMLIAKNLRDCANAMKKAQGNLSHALSGGLGELDRYHPVDLSGSSSMKLTLDESDLSPGDVERISEIISQLSKFEMELRAGIGGMNL